MYDRIFKFQRQLGDADLLRYAKDLDLDIPRWRECYSENRHKARIEADQRQLSAVGVDGTPAFFVNGRFLSGAQPYESFAKLVEEELARAKASGIPRAEYYETAIQKR